MRVLVVEDDVRLCDVLTRGLREQGYAVDSARDGATALEHLAANLYDAVVLDILIPAPNGLEVCRQMRSARMSTPVLMLTARDAVEDRIAGLDCGADDYLVKPFAFTELLARLRALLRRSPVVTSPVIRIGDLTIDTGSHRVMRGGSPVVLTSKEYGLLEYLARNSDRVISRDEIAEHVWDEHYDAFSNVIDVYVNRLRRKIGDSKARRIVTRRSEGYLLRGEEKP